MTTERRINLVVGTYARLGGSGLVPLTYDPPGDQWTPAEPIRGINDASHGVYSPRHELYYFVAEQDEGRISCHVGPGQYWRRSATSGTGGAAPCYIALDKAQRRLVVANYDSGSVAFFRLDPTGSLPLEPAAIRQAEGHGPDRERQAGPHAHWVGFSRDERHLYCVNLGADRISAFPLSDADADPGVAAVAYEAPSGSGPRHLAFHPVCRVAFLVSELASTLSLLQIEADGALTPLEIVPTIPAGVSGSLGGAIAINMAGDRLYVTNRGHDSIAVFAFDGKRLKLLQHVASGGASPRFILLFEDHGRMLVANEEGGSVAAFAIAQDGTLAADPIVLEVPGAVFLAEVQREAH